MLKVTLSHSFNFIKNVFPNLKNMFQYCINLSSSYFQRSELGNVYIKKVIFSKSSVKPRNNKKIECNSKIYFIINTYEQHTFNRDICGLVLFLYVSSYGLNEFLD